MCHTMLFKIVSGPCELAARQITGVCFESLIKFPLILTHADGFIDIYLWRQSTLRDTKQQQISQQEAPVDFAFSHQCFVTLPAVRSTMRKVLYKCIRHPWPPVVGVQSYKENLHKLNQLRFWWW